MRGMAEDTLFLGVDVGTGSVRAGLFDRAGQLLAVAKRDITLWREPGNMVEQSGEEMWSRIADAVREAVERSGRRASQVAGIGFDATCSLVVVGPGGAPLAVGQAQDPNRNVIVWMDHRALSQAERINALGHHVLDYVGGLISPEMQTPKLLWLRENRPDTFAAAWQFFDLADYLTWRATDDLARSTCTVTCKWTYLAHEGRWDADYFERIGLGELAAENFARIGERIIAPGTPCGNGLTARAAAQLGLPEGIAVGGGLIDAHAGGIGSVGVGKGALANLGYVFGTSSCTMTTTREPAKVPGLWGPYHSAMVPGMWLLEGGQSAAGAAIDHLVSLHPAAAEAASRASKERKSLPVMLADLALEKAPTPDAMAALARGIHVVPEFLGNRTPFADPQARAVISGLGTERDLDNLVALYVAGVLSIGYGLRQILEAQEKSGVKVENVVISGGAGAHALVRQLLADACGLPLIVPACPEPVLLGAAILGTVASGVMGSIEAAMEAMSQIGGTYMPMAGKTAQLHAQRYEAFKALQAVGRATRGC